jgi:hypothetical protein
LSEGWTFTKRCSMWQPPSSVPDWSTGGVSHS